MSQYKRIAKSSAPPTNDWEKSTEKSLDEMQDTLTNLLNRGLLFVDNFSSLKTSFVSSAVIGTVTTIAHGLKRIPIGYLIIRKDKAAHIFESASPDITNIYLKSDVASVAVTVLIF